MNAAHIGYDRRAQGERLRSHGVCWRVAVALAGVGLFATAAQAAMKIKEATVQNGVAYVKGNGAAKGVQMTWEGFAVTTANKANGGFAFVGILPDDCSGELSDGTSSVLVAVLGCTPVTAGVPAPLAQTAQKTAWYERWHTVLRDDLDGVAQVIRTLIAHRNRAPLAEADAQTLDTELQYFRRNADKMRYALYRAAGLPIGSGVTAAGCKELIKARFCLSGMRWKRETAAPILHLRAIRLSQQWDCFWKKVLRYAA